jgi:hypothetical protein
VTRARDLSRVVWSNLGALVIRRLGAKFPGESEVFIEVAFRRACYLNRLSGKSYLSLQTTLRPVGT